MGEACSKRCCRREWLWLGVLLALGLAARAALLALPRPFWMDERFTAAVAAQPLGRMLEFCRGDVHPPLYYLAIWGWNRAGLMAWPGGESEWELTDYHLPGIGREGLFTARTADGDTKGIPGLYPEDWGDWPLAPLGFLRAPSVVFAVIGAALLFLLAREFWPARREVGLIAAGMTLFSPFMLTWDTVMRSYSMQGAAIVALALACAHYVRIGNVAAGAAWVGALTAAALLTGYMALLALPFLAGAIWMRSGSRQRALILGAGMACGVAAAGLIWGGAFLDQGALRQVEEEAYAVGVIDRFAREAGAAADTLWRMALSYGITGYLNPFDHPVAYYPVFLLYAGCIGFGLYGLTRGRRGECRGEWFALALSAGPALLAAAANAVRPDSVPIQSRYFYPFAPFYFLFLASGFLAMAGAGGRWRR